MRVLLSAGQVLTGPRDGVVRDGAVLLDGSRIDAVGPRTELTALAPDAARVDRPDGTVLPGLIDAHVHLAFEPGTGLAASLEGVDDVSLTARMIGHLQRLTDGGVTTARDLGDRGGLGVVVRDGLAAGAFGGPRLLVAGAPLTPPGGYCWFLGGEVDPTPAALRDAVRARAAQRVDVVKVMASGGQSTAGGAAMWESQFDREALGVIVDEAARHGLPVAAHAHGADSIADAVAAGVSTIEHCSWMTGRGTSAFRPEVAAAMAEAGIVACSGSAGRSEGLARKVGAERVRELFGRMRRMADHGVPVMIGTDAGLGPFDDFAGAVARWGRWGFDPATMIEMATVDAARHLGLGGVTGALVPGLAADVLVVRGDPTADLAALAEIELVVTRGAFLRGVDPRR